MQIDVADEIRAAGAIQGRQLPVRADGRQHGDFVVEAAPRQYAVALPVLGQAEARAARAAPDHQQAMEVKQRIAQHDVPLQTAGRQIELTKPLPLRRAVRLREQTLQVGQQALALPLLGRQIVGRDALDGAEVVDQLPDVAEHFARPFGHEIDDGLFTVGIRIAHRKLCNPRARPQIDLERRDQQLVVRGGRGNIVPARLEHTDLHIVPAHQRRFGDDAARHLKQRLLSPFRPINLPIEPPSRGERHRGLQAKGADVRHWAGGTQQLDRVLALRDAHRALLLPPSLARLPTSGHARDAKADLLAVQVDLHRTRAGGRVQRDEAVVGGNGKIQVVL